MYITHLCSANGLGADKLHRHQLLPTARQGLMGRKQHVSMFKSTVAIFYLDNPTVRLPGAQPHMLLLALQITTVDTCM